MPTIAESLRDSRNVLKKKMREVAREKQKAYNKSMNIKKGVKSGNTRKRRKGAQVSITPIDDSILEVGRGAGEVGA